MNTNHKHKIIGIICPGESLCSDALYAFGNELGHLLGSHNMSLVCGGLGGFMQAVCEGFQQAPEPRQGKAIGILPGEHASTANPYVDIAHQIGI